MSSVDVTDAKKYLHEHNVPDIVNKAILELVATKPLNVPHALSQIFGQMSSNQVPVPSEPLFPTYLSMMKEVGAEVVPYVEPFRAGDVLIVVDVQNDFVPPGSFGVSGCGSFGVAEGEVAALLICEMIDKMAAVGGTIIATRDYHPSDHCSFSIFPPHCVQGSPGSYFCPPIKSALTRARQLRKDSVRVVFKGFCETIDSFGAFQYNEASAKGRLTHKEDLSKEELSCSVTWTGSFELNASWLDKDLDAPPDVKSVLKKDDGRLDKVIGDKKRRVFVCGLTFDFCVLDTAYNARMCDPPYESVYIVLDASRPAYNAKTGKYRGYLSDPKEIKKKLDTGIHLVNTSQCL